MPYWWGIMRRKQISMAATCTLLVALKNLTECLSLPSSLSYLNTEVDEVSTLLSLLYATFWFFFFFFSAYPFSFLSFSGRKCNKKNLHWREETWQSWTEFAHFSWCMLPKKKKHLPRDYSKTLQVVTFSLYLMVLKKFQHQVQRVHLPRRTY